MLFVAVLTAAAAQLSVQLPFTEVPFTLQPMVVLLGGLALGSRLGLGSQVLYLFAGIAGLPVFAPSPAASSGRTAADRTDRGLPAGLSDCRLARWRTCRAGTRSTVRQFCRGDAGRTCRRLCMRHVLAGVRRAKLLAQTPMGLQAALVGRCISVRHGGRAEAARSRGHLSDALAAGWARKTR